MITRMTHVSFRMLAVLLIPAVLIVLGRPMTCLSEDHHKVIMTQRMEDIVHRHVKTMIEWAGDPILVDAVKEQNRKKVSLDEIKRIDKDWLDGKAEKFAMSLQSNTSGILLKQKVETNKILYVEAFLCDNQGAVVGEFPKTSDYWQGDEEKFTLCFNNGQGKVYINPLTYDESTKTYSVQISVPVKDMDKTIGVLIVGLKNIH